MLVLGVLCMLGWWIVLGLSALGKFVATGTSQHSEQKAFLMLLASERVGVGMQSVQCWLDGTA